MSKYELKDRVPCDDQDIISVIGDNYHLYLIGPDEMTWKDLIEKSVMNYRVRHFGTCRIIIEGPLGSKVYVFGNYDRKYVYENGRVDGYA